jgi:hypothetical protein
MAYDARTARDSCLPREDTQLDSTALITQFHDFFVVFVLFVVNLTFLLP